MDRLGIAFLVAALAGFAALLFPLWRTWTLGIASLAGFITLAVLFLVVPGDAIRQLPGVLIWFELEVLFGMAALGLLVSAARALRGRALLRRQ